MNDELRNGERDPEDGLDRMLRPAMRWEAPPQLTSNLLAMIAVAPSIMAAMPPDLAFGPRPRPKRWYVVLVTILTILAIGVSLLVAWDLYGVVISELGLPALLSSIYTSMSESVNQFFAKMPQLGMFITMLAGVRNYLYWLLLVAVLWAVLDGWSPRPSSPQQAS